MILIKEPTKKSPEELEGFFILIINALLGWILYRKDKFMAQILNFITCLCQIFIVIASFLLVFLNI